MKTIMKITSATHTVSPPGLIGDGDLIGLPGGLVGRAHVQDPGGWRTLGEGSLVAFTWRRSRRFMMVNDG